MHMILHNVNSYISTAAALSGCDRDCMSHKVCLALQRKSSTQVPSVLVSEALRERGRLQVSSLKDI